MADAVVAHLFSRVSPGVDVVFLDTGLHFPETLKVRDTVARTMNVNVRSIRPRMTVGQQDGEYGPRLFARSPDECCFMRKVEPLERALADYDAWATGLRRDESPTRANTPVVAFDAKRGKVKVNPIAAWTQADVDRYIAAGTCRSTSCSRRATGRSAAGRAPGAPRPARTRAPVAGRCSRRPNAACTSDAVVLVAHGSRDPRARRATEALARAVAAPTRSGRCAPPIWTTPARARWTCCLAGAAGTGGRCWCRCC